MTPFYIEAISASTVTLTFRKNAGTTWDYPDFICSTGTTSPTTWIDISGGNYIAAGTRLYIKSKNTSQRLSVNSSTFVHFGISGKAKLGGNIISLKLNSNGTTGLSSYEFYNMFSGSTGITECSSDLFSGITSLARSCYYGMFEECTKLTTAPDLPATSLAEYCYSNMFDGCTLLTTAPVLPATVLANRCYYMMFDGCTSLTTAPELPATTLADNCYAWMFYDCTNLNYIKCLATDISATNCTSHWVDGVASTGTFVKSADMSGWTVDSTSGIPVGWTVRNDGENLNYFYFEAKANGSTIELLPHNNMSTPISLECSPDLTTWTSFTTGTTYALDRGDTMYIRGNNGGFGYSPSDEIYYYFNITGNVKLGGNIVSLLDTTMTATTLHSDCFYCFFKDCTGITECDTNLFSGFTNVGYYSLAYMFSGCTNLTTAPELPMTVLSASTESYSSSYRGMFLGCTSLTTAPSTLPATELKNHCYADMFNGCTSLTTAPTLPATTLAPSCYRQMFMNCTSLTTAPALPATTLENGTYAFMFAGCTSLTSAPVLSALTLSTVSYMGMFSGCSSLNYIECLATDISASQSTSGWVSGVAPTGTFKQNTNMTSWTRGTDGIPINWTVEGGLEMNIEFRLTSADNWAQTLDIPKEDTSATGGTLDFYVRYTPKSSSFSTGFSGFTPSIAYWNVQVLGSTGATEFPPVLITNYRLSYYGNTTGAKITENLLFRIQDSYDQEVLVSSGMVVEQSPTNFSMSVSPSAITVDYDQTAYQYIDISYTNMITSATTFYTSSDMFDDIEWVDDSTKTRLRVKCSENETTSVRTGTVQVWGISVGYDNVQAFITFTQNPREIHYGTITPIPNSISADVEDNYYYVSVEYSGFTSIGTVTATTSADWIDLEWQDDQTKTSLKVDVDTNYETSARTATIEISGTDDWDNVITAYVEVSQPGINNQTYPIWKDVYFTGATDTFDYFIVNEDTMETIYQGRAYVQPNSTNVKVNVSKIVQNYLNNNIPDGNDIKLTNFVYYNQDSVIEIGIYDTTTSSRVEKYIYYYNWDYDMFDYSHPYMPEMDPILLTKPINGHATPNMSLLYTEYDFENAYLTANMQLYYEQITPEEYEIMKKFYDLNYCGDYALYYLQRNGGWASFLIEGNSKKTDSYEKYSYNMSFNNTTAEFEEKNYHVQITSKWQLHTKTLTDSQAENLAFNLLSSNNVFLHDLKQNKIIPVTISNAEAEYLTFKNNGRKMITYTIEVTESQKKQVL